MLQSPTPERNNRNADGRHAAAGSLTFNPLYKEVKIRLTRGLAAGEWKAGKRYRAKSRLAERFNVSIGTIRKAIDELVAERILLRHQGRGTFVATHTEDRTLFYFFHIVGKDGSREVPDDRAPVVSHGARRRDRGSAARASSARPPSSAYRMCSSSEGALSCSTRSRCRRRSFPDLDEDVFRAREGTIYGLYQARYGISVIRISERLSAGHASARGAAVLGIDTGEPALMIKRVAYSYDDTPVEYRVSWVNTERHEYLSDLWKSEGQR